MRPPPIRQIATVGVAENGSSAVLVTLGPRGELIDRRTLALTTPDLPTHPHHHEGSWAVGRYLDSPWAKAISLPEAIALVERVRAVASARARDALAALATSVSLPIAAISLRACPDLPPTVEARIRDHRAQTVADTVMYREVIAGAAKARDWAVSWYDRDAVFREAAEILGLRDLDVALRDMGRACGPPWQAKHKLAAAAALAARRNP